MNSSNQLINDGILDANQVDKINNFEREKPMSVHWELKTILYLGILLFIAGIGILVYQNIDTIGHIVIIGLITVACFSCFYYGFKHKKTYSNKEVKHDSPLFDNVVLLACLLFGVLIAYIQYQYVLFGLHYGLATLFPAVLYLYTAYVFDHKGLLSLGITAFAAWIGISVTPFNLLAVNDFSSLRIIWTSISVGAILLAYSKFADFKDLKKHFGFTYNIFAVNILFVALLAGLFTDKDLRIGYILLLSLLMVYYLRYAIAQKSFLFLLLSVIYGYIATTYLFFTLIIHAIQDISIALIYIIVSCIGTVYFFINYKRILKIKNDSL